MLLENIFVANRLLVLLSWIQKALGDWIDPICWVHLELLAK